MKIKTIVVLSLVSLFWVSWAPTEIPRADNFSFIYEEYFCGHLPLQNVLDTSKGILTHTPLGEAESMEIPFVLSENEMEMIYQKILSTKYFDYPSEVRVPGREVPFSAFRLKVVNGDFANDVKWTDDFNLEPNFPEDDGLIELFRLIQKIIRSHPEYPEPKAGCA